MLEGRPAQVGLTLSQVSGRAVTALVTTSNLSAGTGDYTPMNQTVVVPAGATSVAFSIATARDASSRRTRRSV